MKIPDNEQENVLRVMLKITRELELRAFWPRDMKDLRKQVVDSFNILNRIGYTQERPGWEGE